MEVIGEAFLSAALDSLLGILKSQEFIKFARKQQVDKELKKWESKLVQIHAVLDDAEEKQVNNRALKLWLTKLRGLAYDAEDILDEFYTEALQSKLKGEESEASTSAMKLLPTCCAALKPSGVRRNMTMASKLEGITERLEEILTEKKELDLVTIAGGRSNKFVYKRMPTASQIKEPKVYGREKDKEAIVELLMRAEPNNSPYSVIPIIGMGGVGKTTLAQLVYEEMVEFDCKAWVCVSDDFDIIKITKTILQHWGSCEDNDLNVLQDKLKKKLLGNKFFVVLDDVWNLDYELWTSLRSPFAAGAPGSIVIVTTRLKDVSLQMGSVPGHELKELSNDDCMSLFAQHALGAENFDANPDLKEIGQQIVLRCKGLPLTAKTLGGLLRGKQSVKDWEFILNSKMWDLPEGQSNILPALRLSYYYLPSYLKQCFGFCAIFPKDYEFEKKELVLLWMAEGFLQQPRGRKQAEDMGDGYFDDLLSKSFFQQSSRDNSRYIMHDLISDLAQFVSGGICFLLDDKLNKADAESYNSVRHLSLIAEEYDTWQRFEGFYEMQNLRTFYVFPRDYGCYLSRKVLDDLVPKLKCLRAVSLPYYNIKELPDSIGALKHLRYLNLSRNPIKQLPPSLTELINLQTLLLCGCDKLVELPMDMGNLINLQYLDISDTDSLQVMPPQMSQLKNLCSLSKFVVGEGSGLSIGGLSKLSHLQGQLLVKGLHNVSNDQDAKRANLKEKQGLRELSLEWSHTSDSWQNERNELEVLNSLKPHQSLEKLSVTAYGGTGFPPWVGDPCFTKMVELKLHDCHKLTSLSSIWKLPVLRYLSIKGMNEVKEVEAGAIPALETLKITNMPEWEQWSWSLGHDCTGGDEFPNLRKLTLRNCPKLNGILPCCLPSLKELCVDGCQEMVLRSLGDLPSLTDLDIKEISGLESLHGIPVQALVALENLNVWFCNELKYLWQDGNDLDKLANLKDLKIYDCEQLASLVEGEKGLLPCNLQILGIERCSNLEKMPNGLHSLTSLRELEIRGSSKLVSFPEGAGLPHALKRLEFGSCGSLESLPYGLMSTGHDSSSNQCLLEALKIWGCASLKSFPEGKLPTKLKFLEIWGCINLESLPASEFPPLKTLRISGVKMQQLFPSSHSLSHVTHLNIYNCHELESFPADATPLPNLTFLYIAFCEKLKSVANFIDNLTSLQLLRISRCSSLESFITSSGLPTDLTSLTISECENLRQPMSEWGLHALTSLEILEIGFESPFCTTTDVDYFPDDNAAALLLPTSITSLEIYSHKNLKSISRGIQHLTSIQRLFIKNCPKLKFLPTEGFPSTLGYLVLEGCPRLRERCKKDHGDYWSIIAHIPRVDIY